MKKTSHYLSALIMVACFTQPVSAQFEGKITFNSYEHTAPDTEQERDEFTMFITPDRILLQGERNYEFMNAIKTEGVLVRLDFQDFVFLTGDDNVLKVSKSDITRMMDFFGGGSTASDVTEKTEDINFERTDEAATIKGYESEKFIFRDESSPNEHTEIWMTKELKMNWGMLADPWSGNVGAIVDNFPTDLIFKENYFPLKVETYKNNKLVSSLEATEVAQSPIAKAMVQVPNGVNVLGLWDFLSQEAAKRRN